jgi:hypothetical protein
VEHAGARYDFGLRASSQSGLAEPAGAPELFVVGITLSLAAGWGVRITLPLLSTAVAMAVFKTGVANQPTKSAGAKKEAKFTER